jgi:hypothetical protein
MVPAHYTYMKAEEGTVMDNFDPREFDTVLQTVWFCANYYYQSSYNARSEYYGIIFKKPNGRYGTTIHRDGGFSTSYITTKDVPPEYDIVAGWHTHLPATALTKSRLAGMLLEGFLGGAFEDFSDSDKALATKVRARARAYYKNQGRQVQPFTYYLVTATVIKRYTPGHKMPAVWNKPAPSKMAATWPW